MARRGWRTRLADTLMRWGAALRPPQPLSPAPARISLPPEPRHEGVLAVPTRKVVIAVDAGRNLAVLVEAAVRNTILQLRGIDTYQEFIDRHQRALERPQSDRD